MKKTKGINKKLAVYLIFTFGCLLAGCVFLIYVSSVVDEYDKAQPEKTVEIELKSIADGSLLSGVDFGSRSSSRFEDNDPEEIEAAYRSRLKGKLTYKLAGESSDGGNSDELTKTYVISADEKPVARLTLKGENPRTSLFFFSMADWAAESFEPILSDTVYNLKLYCPEEITLTINGVAPDEREQVSGSDIPLYSIEGLLSEPEIKYTNADGKEISFAYAADGSTVMPLVYNYTLTLPEGISVYKNGEKLDGEAKGGNTTLQKPTPKGGMDAAQPSVGGDYVYTIREMNETDVLLKDLLGNELSYGGESTIPLKKYSVSVPDGFTVRIGDVLLSDVITPSAADNSDSEKLQKQAGITLPQLNKYEFSSLGEISSVTVSDGVESAEYSLGKDLTVATLGSGEIPADADVLGIAKTWSKFMTDDLTGDTHGFGEIAQYLIEDSDYYKYAYEWATGIDITFTSPHTLDGFANESVGNFTSYGENCFSCTVYFEKNMSLYSNGNFAGARTDVFNSVMYFVKVDGAWRIALMYDNLDEGQL